MQPEPTHADIEAVFLGLLDGRLTRDEVDRWASQWIATDDPDIRDSNTRWALEHLYGIDLTHGVRRHPPQDRKRRCSLSSARLVALYGADKPRAGTTRR
jgi:hypothetical protein